MLSSRIQASSPVASDQSEAILAAFDEWAKTVEGRARTAGHHSNGYGSPDRRAEDLRVHPAIAASERSIYGDGRSPAFHRQPIVRQRPSVAKRIFYAVVYILVAGAIASAALAWRPSDDKIKEIVAGWESSLDRVSSILGVRSVPSANDKIKDIVAAWESSLSHVSSILGVRSPLSANVLAAAPVSSVPDQAPAEDEAVPQEASVTPSATAPDTPSATAPVPAGVSPEVQQQLATIEDDLAAMRQVMEQIAGKQQQMAQDIAALQAAQQKVSQAISPPNLRPSFQAAPRKTVAKPVRPEPPVDLAPVPAPTPVPATPPQPPADLH